MNVFSNDIALQRRIFYQGEKNESINRSKWTEWRGIESTLYESIKSESKSQKVPCETFFALVNLYELL